MANDRGRYAKAMAAGAVYFALVFAAGFALGTIRVLLLVPRLGVRTAELLEMPVMFVIILLAARFVVRRFSTPDAAKSRLVVGCTALSLAVAAELLVAVAFQRQSIGETIAGRDPVSGSVFLAMLVLFGAMPLIIAMPRFRK